MRWSLLVIALAACRGGGVSKEQELCARAAAMFEKCEELGSGSDAKLANELTAIAGVACVAPCWPARPSS